MGSSLRSSAKDFRMAWGELFLYAWSCLYGYWLIAAPARCWPVVSHAQRKHDRRKTPTLPFMRSLLINLLLRRAAASFNHPAAGKAGFARRLTIGGRWPGLPDADRYTKPRGT